MGIGNTAENSSILWSSIDKWIEFINRQHQRLVNWRFFVGSKWSNQKYSVFSCITERAISKGLLKHRNKAPISDNIGFYEEKLKSIVFWQSSKGDNWSSPVFEPRRSNFTGKYQKNVIVMEAISFSDIASQRRWNVSSWTEEKQNYWTKSD